MQRSPLESLILSFALALSIVTPLALAQTQTVELDGQKVAFASLGDAIDYQGVLNRASRADPYTYNDGRAFRLDGAKTLRLEETFATSSDCANAGDFVGPTYMVLAMVSGKDPEIIRTTEGAEVDGGSPIPRVALADFPGELKAGTYVLTVDYMSFDRPCHISGSFTLAE